jgi:hypothetical protein
MNINENNIEQARNTLMNRVGNDKVLKDLISFDPTPSKGYLSWLVKQYIKNRYNLDLLWSIHGYLYSFWNGVQKQYIRSPWNSLNIYPTVEEFVSFMEGEYPKIIKKQKDKRKRKSKIGWLNNKEEIRNFEIFEDWEERHPNDEVLWQAKFHNYLFWIIIEQKNKDLKVLLFTTNPKIAKKDDDSIAEIRMGFEWFKKKDWWASRGTSMNRKIQNSGFGKVMYKVLLNYCMTGPTKAYGIMSFPKMQASETNALYHSLGAIEKYGRIFILANRGK